jgi:hypothetical protein
LRYIGEGRLHEKPSTVKEADGMYRIGKAGKDAKNKGQEKQKTRKSLSLGGRDILRREAQFRIAPKHPGMGRR